MAGELQGLSALAEAFYGQPKLNAVGINAQGQPVDAQGNVTTMWSQPGWFQRAVNPEAQEVQRMNQQYSAAPIVAQQNQILQNQAIGRNVDAQPWTNNPYANAFNVPQTNSDYNVPDPTQAHTQARNAWISSIAQPALDPSNERTQLESMGGIPYAKAIGATQAGNTLSGAQSLATNNVPWLEGADRGAGLQYDINNMIPRIGNASAIAAAQSGTQLANSQMEQQLTQSKATQLPTLLDTQRQQITNEATKAGLDSKQLANLLQQTEEDAKSIGPDSALHRASTYLQQLQANRETSGAPILDEIYRNTNVGNLIASRYQQDPSIEHPYVLSQGDDGQWHTSGGQLNPMYRPATLAPMQAMARYGMTADGKPLGNGGITTKSGNVYPTPPPDTTVHLPVTPTIGQHMSTEEGQDKIDSHEDVAGAYHDANIAKAKADKAAMQAQIAALRAQHLHTGALPTIGRGVSGAASDVGNMFGDVGKWYYDKAKLIGQPIYNTLIGQ